MREESKILQSIFEVMYPKIKVKWSKIIIILYHLENLPGTWVTTNGVTIPNALLELVT